MLKIGTELIGKQEIVPGSRPRHTIEEIRITDNGTAMYRAHPYQVWMTEGEIRRRFDFVHPPKNTWWERLAANLKRFGEIMETPVGK